MNAGPGTAPGFGEADLSNCEREPIHLAASIQPFGALLVVREADGVVVQASLDAGRFLGLAEPPLNHSIASLPGDLWPQVRPFLDGPRLSAPAVLRCRIGVPEQAFDALLHHPPGGGLVIELEHAGTPVDLALNVAAALKTIVTAASLRVLCDQTARIFEQVTGYDRVMVYRFDDDGHGEVFSEQRQPELEAYLGNRYPASDIPQIARRLYERNRVRVLADVAYDPVPLQPRLSPIDGQDLDMSLCFLRSMSPIHIQYLKNMGVAATLVVSLVVGGRLWGLIACHHYSPRFIHFEVRAVCEVLAETIATRIAALESFLQGQAELSVRRLEHRMSEAIQHEGDWRIALFDGSSALLQPFGATGAALLFEGQILTVGEVPALSDLRDLGGWLDRRVRQPVFETASLGRDAPGFAALSRVASGVLAVPVSSLAGEYLMWFRPEVVSTVTWAGDPFKPSEQGDSPAQLSPRRSFAQWHQQVEGTAEKWSQADVAAARLIGESITDIVLQFRLVRVLIAQDQLEQVTGQVRVSTQPVLVADAAGRIILRNDAFSRMRGGNPPASLEELPALFAEPVQVARGIDDLRTTRRGWRGEVRLQSDDGAKRPLLIRGDVVFASPDRVLGYVLMFTDLSERHAADAARRRFQESIVQGRREMPAQLDATAAHMLQSLLGSVVENAQLAGLEITDGLDLARVPALLESVQSSVGRAAEVLQHLVGHAADSARDH